MVYRFFCRNNIAYSTSYNALYLIADDRLALFENFHLVLIERTVVDMPPHILIGLANDLRLARKAKRIEEFIICSDKSPVGVFPENIYIGGSFHGFPDILFKPLVTWYQVDFLSLF